MFLAATLLLAVISGMLLGLITLQKRQIREQEARRVESIITSVARTAKESLSSKDDIMLLSYLRFQMAENPEIEICMVTRNGYTSIVGQVKSDLTYRTINVSYPEAGPGSEAVTIQAGFSKASLENKLKEAYSSLLVIALGVTAIGLALGLAGALWISRKLARPVAELSAAAEEFGKGRLDVTVAASGKDEIATLAGAFNRMAANIRESVTAKEDLLSTLTHELNNPLAGVKSYISILRDPMRVTTIQETRQAYDTMAEAVGQMELTLSNALELFRTSAKPTIDPEVVDLGEMAQEIISLYGPVARSSHIELKTSIPDRRPILNADRKLLRRVMINLVSNAIKYTPSRGKILVSIKEEDGNVVLSVADTGYGISQEDQKLLFTKFYRTDGPDGRRRKIPGSGLGLAIAKQAAELHHGKIWLQSEKGKGSTFFVSIPKAGSGEGL